MLPSASDPRWAQLVSGEIAHNFKQVSGGMMMSRLKREIASNSSPENMAKCVQQAYDFFLKYQAILHDDISAIFK